MATKAVRKIVRIDESKCNGCGLCVPNCAEGAIQIIDGKARLVAENLCDGLGACLGECPLGAITIEQRPAEVFDEAAVHARQHSAVAKAEATAVSSSICSSGAGGGFGGGCPGSALRQLRPQRPAAATAAGEAPQGAAAQSQLGHWPVQLSLVPTAGAMWQDADVLIAADCVPFAMPDFHARLLAGKTLAIACPKLDDVLAYVDKLAAIFAANTVRSVTVARMEVPCCGGIVRAVRAALEQAGRNDIPVREVTIRIDGNLAEAGA